MESEILIQLYKKQANIILGYFIKMGCKKEEAEDIVHDSFVKAIQYMDGVSADKLSSWLFKVAINNYKNRVKRNSIISQISIEEKSAFVNLIGDSDVVQDILLYEKNNEINQCLNNLKEEYQSLLIFKYEMDLSYREISKLLGISESMVKTYLYRARNEFKKNWRENNE